MRRVCVFCGSNSGMSPAFAELARGFGRALVARKLELVYGGGNVGLMGEVADSVLAAGGRVIGVIPSALREKELAHEGAQVMHVVGTMHERKAKMAELSDAFVALPGGFGTLDEICEVLTWTQLGVHDKPCALLDVEGYWRPLSRMFDQAVASGFLRIENRRALIEETEPERLLDALERWRPERREKWIGRGEV
jgi:uncharacterized protein (TIGR00730 family)